MTAHTARPAAVLMLVAALLLLFTPANASAETQHVAMENYAYSPATLTIRVGDTVSWTNHDQAPHDVVTTSAPAAFRSPLLNTGETWSFTFTVPGTYAYYCSVHPDMRAQITVEPAETETPAPAPAPAPAPEEETPAPTPEAAPTAAPAPVAPTSAPTSTTAPAQQTAQATMSEPSLDPMLLVAGLVAGVTILCLLLMNARPEP
jgi:plastocyanin